MLFCSSDETIKGTNMLLCGWMEVVGVVENRDEDVGIRERRLGCGQQFLESLLYQCGILLFPIIKTKG